MKSLASLILVAAATSAHAQEPPAGVGPRGSSERAAGEVRYDAVGYAATGKIDGVRAASDVLPAGSFAEVTALDTGRTIVVAVVTGPIPPQRVVALSPAAAAALGMDGERFAVRIRKVVPTPQDVVQSRDGGAASSRAEAPPALLVALRKLLPTSLQSTVVAVASPAPHPIPTPVAKPAPVVKPAPSAPKPISRTLTPKGASSGYVVQVAALSNAVRAATVARAVGGTVIPGPPTWRVRLGPYPDTAAATRAKAQAARAGYPGGQISRIP